MPHLTAAQKTTPDRRQLAGLYRRLRRDARTFAADVRTQAADPDPWEPGTETAYYRQALSEMLQDARQLQAAGCLAGREVPAPSFPPRAYVNAYAVDQCYGGPEEGGWYYDAGTLLASVPVTSREDADQARERLREMFGPDYADNKPREHTNGGPNLEIYIDEEIGRDFPARKPFYE
jgi:hypothetical protein